MFWVFFCFICFFDLSCFVGVDDGVDVAVVVVVVVVVVVIVFCCCCCCCCYRSGLMHIELSQRVCLVCQAGMSR